MPFNKAELETEEFNNKEKITNQPEKRPEIRPEVEVEKPVEAEKPVPEAPAEPEKEEKPKEVDEEKPPTVAPAAPAEPAQPLKSKSVMEIEEVLQEDIGPVYAKMPDKLKNEFRKKGEETATTVDTLIHQVKTKTKKILDAIKEWLKIIPGVNKFFLEQEAKIKTDKIMKIKEREEKDKQQKV